MFIDVPIHKRKNVFLTRLFTNVKALHSALSLRKFVRFLYLCTFKFVFVLVSALSSQYLDSK